MKNESIFKKLWKTVHLSLDSINELMEDFGGMILLFITFGIIGLAFMFGFFAGIRYLLGY